MAELLLALALWGVSGVSVDVRFEDVPQPYAEVYADQELGDPCGIVVPRGFEGAYLARVLIHETGHCLGLGHSGDRLSIMHRYVAGPWEWEQTITPEDWAALFRARPPMPWRVVTGVASDGEENR